MKNIVIRKGINVKGEELEVLISVYENRLNKAIKSNWNCLIENKDYPYMPLKSGDTIAELTVGKYLVNLFATRDSFVLHLCKESVFNNEVYSLIYNVLESKVFKAKPKSMDELVEILMSLLGNIREEDLIEPSDFNKITIEREFKNTNTNKTINYSITLNRTALELAILSNWDSLVFADNETIFATIKTENFMIDLTTCGSVLIASTDENEGIVFSNLNHKELANLVLKEGCLNEDDYYTIENNWFSLLLSNKVTGNLYQTYDDVIYAETPESIEEFISSLIKYGEDILKRELN